LARSKCPHEGDAIAYAGTDEFFKSGQLVNELLTFERAPVNAIGDYNASLSRPTLVNRLEECERASGSFQIEA
jgi:hypothetical protein